ncbi:hypothetical protein ZIOFF_004062 [Zingiber officinale]|uniref:BHLH domain-containing protein n=1 Tax=Zingiber officinale TaxID=94328 RepID=A0A8J5INM9_ZINOF|nr:hypothetical protein ZIOFF_004062 [Zingiber officinale]
MIAIGRAVLEGEEEKLQGRVNVVLFQLPAALDQQITGRHAGPHHRIPPPPFPNGIFFLYTCFFMRLGGSYAGEDEKHDAKIIESCWENQIADASTGAKHESCGSGYMIQSPRSSEVIVQASRCSWSHQVLTPPVSSTTVRSNLLEFSNTIKPADSSPECNSTATGGALKRAKIQGSFAAHSTLKVRKEKLGDRITALHQIVSPFGKTDTASVLQEAIGYIRFLQSQIEALTTPYLSSTSGNMKQPPTESTVEDLRSRGLCLMPISFILHVLSIVEASAVLAACTVSLAVTLNED